MVTRKRKAPAKVAEAAPTYTARSRRVAAKPKKPAQGRRPGQRTKRSSPGEALWEYFLTLSEEEHGAFIMKMLEDADWREDIIDIAVMVARRNDPTDDYEEFEEALRSEGRL